MHHHFLCFAPLFFATFLSAQDGTESSSEGRDARRWHQSGEQTLFRNARLTGGFGGPIVSFSAAKGSNGIGNGGGGGLVFNHLFLGAFGMGEFLDSPKNGNQSPALGYGGLWIGYTFPTNKLMHLYTSVKLAGGAVGTASYRNRWNWEVNEDLDDLVFVGIPEAGLELNVTRWFRIGGSVGYRFVNGFAGWESFDKNDLNMPVYALTFRFGWF